MQMLHTGPENLLRSLSTQPWLVTIQVGPGPGGGKQDSSRETFQSKDLIRTHSVPAELRPFRAPSILHLSLTPASRTLKHGSYGAHNGEKGAHAKKSKGMPPRLIS